MTTIFILDVVLTVILLLPWTIYLVCLTKGVFEEQPDLCAPVCDINKKENS